MALNGIFDANTRINAPNGLMFFTTPFKTAPTPEVAWGLLGGDGEREKASPSKLSPSIGNLARFPGKKKKLEK